MIKKNRCLAFLTVLLVLGASVLHAGSNFRMSEIQKSGNQPTSTARNEILSNRSSGDRKTVIIRGTFDGDGTFVFQGDKIIYRNGSYDYPANVSVNGKNWRILDDPFELGFTPVFSSAELLEKEGRNAERIRLTKYEDRVELYLYDSDASYAQYRVSIAFDDERVLQQKKAEEQKKAEPRKKSEDKKIVEDDDGGKFYVSLPEDDKNAKNEKASAEEKTAAAAKKEYGEQDKLHGVLYPLVLRSKDRSSLISLNKESGAGSGSGVLPILQKFVLGQWQQLSDAPGRIHYSELDQHFSRQPAPSLSFFYQDMINWQDGAALFRRRNNAGKYINFDAGSGWLAIYSGYVIAPFDGKFRFLGYGDDMMVVRFNRQIVLDYGLYSLTTGMSLDSTSTTSTTFLSVLGGNPSTPEERRKIAGSPLYSKYKLTVRYPTFDRNHGLAESPVLNVQKGQIIPIDILLAERASQRFCMVLLVERLDANGNRRDDPRAVSLFRTMPELPDIPEDCSLPSFYSDGPVWKVIDVNGKSLSQ